jgi:hypothetical protein
MNTSFLNSSLERNDIASQFKKSLISFQLNKKDLSLKRGYYVYGSPGSGKTEFVISVLKEMDYDIIKYDTGDIRNKSIIELLTKENISDKNIVSMFTKKQRYIAIIMDEIDGMNNGDKGGINSLIRLIRPKKTKKQKLEETVYVPIICISNYHVDKKIKDLMKVCNTIELKSPTVEQMGNLITNLLPNLQEEHRGLNKNGDGSLFQKYLLSYIQGDLRKLKSVYELYKMNTSILSSEIIQNILKPRLYNDDTKEITKKMINNKMDLDDHLYLMNETDRTIVGLLWHENIIDVLAKHSYKKTIPFYLNMLSNFCFADYIDRITFQKQIWQFNELSSLIKSFHCNNMFHSEFKKTKYNPSEVRFTKVLTKYSTEYNNTLFVNNLCQQLCMDKKDLFAFFMRLKRDSSEQVFTKTVNDIIEKFDITKLDINRMYRYIEKYTIQSVDSSEENEDTINDDA